MFSKNIDKKIMKLLSKLDSELDKMSIEEAISILVRYNGYRKSNGMKHSNISLCTDKQLEIIATEVIDGKYGSGVQRISNLKEAGYDYELIQKIVNLAVTKMNIPKKLANRTDNLTEVDMDAKHKYGDKWTTELIVALMRKYMACRDEITGRYDPEVKSKIYYQYDIPADTSISNKVNAFINDTLYKNDKWGLITGHYFTKEQLVKWKWKDKKVLKMCIEKGTIPDDELEIMKGCI